MATLHIFDFDDTLVRSSDEVRIVHADGTEEKMMSDEFATYVEQPGDEYDFSAFDSAPKDPRIVEGVFAELRAAIALDGPESTIILTARSNTKPVYDFLVDNNIKGVEIKGTASDDPMMKATFILDKIKGGAYDEVRVFEDNARNIRTIRKIIEPTGIKLQTNRVTKKGVYAESYDYRKSRRRIRRIRRW